MTAHLAATLAERVMALTGARKAADLAIWEASDPQAFNNAYYDARFMLSRDMAEADKRKAALSRMKPPAFTASLDAAMTLVPEGWDWFRWSPGTMVVSKPHESEKLFARTIEARGATPALALLAAALLARAEQENQK